MLTLVGYGTLLYRASLAMTIGEERGFATPLAPVVVPGYRRLFNLRAAHYSSSHRVSAEPIERGAANVEPAPGGSLNAVAFEVDEAEIALLDEREPYYRRVGVPIACFESGASLGSGQIYTAPADADFLDRDPRRLLPRWRDLDCARRGAYAIGRAFGESYDRSTFLADGRTEARRFYGRLLDDHGEVAAG